MEEIIVLGFLLFVLAVVMIIFFGSIKEIFLKSKNDVWTGEVVGKKYRNKIDRIYFLLVRTDEKIQRRIQLSRDRWIKFKVGDVLEKQMGRLFPKKIS